VVCIGKQDKGDGSAVEIYKAKRLQHETAGGQILFELDGEAIGRVGTISARDLRERTSQYVKDPVLRL